MSVAVAAGSCSRASREFQRGVEVISDSVAMVVVVGKKGGRRGKAREISLMKLSVRLVYRKHVCYNSFAN